MSNDNGAVIGVGVAHEIVVWREDDAVMLRLETATREFTVKLSVDSALMLARHLSVFAGDEK